MSGANCGMIGRTKLINLITGYLVRGIQRQPQLDDSTSHV